VGLLGHRLDDAPVPCAPRLPARSSWPGGMTAGLRCAGAVEKSARCSPRRATPVNAGGGGRADVPRRGPRGKSHWQDTIGAVGRGSPVATGAVHERAAGCRPDDVARRRVTPRRRSRGGAARVAPHPEGTSKARAERSPAAQLPPAPAGEPSRGMLAPTA
jgi:hypothetical protein